MSFHSLDNLTRASPLLDASRYGPAAPKLVAMVTGGAWECHRWIARPRKPPVGFYSEPLAQSVAKIWPTEKWTDGRTDDRRRRQTDRRHLSLLHGPTTSSRPIINITLGAFNIALWTFHFPVVNTNLNRFKNQFHISIKVLPNVRISFKIIVSFNQYSLLRLIRLSLLNLNCKWCRTWPDSPVCKELISCHQHRHQLGSTVDRH